MDNEDIYDYIYQRLIEKNLNRTENELKTLTKRLIKATNYYIESNDYVDEDGMIRLLKLDFLLLKLNIAVVHKLLDQKTIRVKGILSTTLYEINDDLKQQYQSRINKMDSTDSYSCSIYKCKRCGEKKHSMKEFMSRALDEPRSIKNICLVCGYSWIVH